MAYNIKPSAPPLDAIDENNISRGEGETIEHWTNNSNQQPIQQQPIQQSVKQQSIHQSIHQPVRQPIHQPVRQPIHQPVRQPIHQPVRQPIHQPVRQNVLQQGYPVCQQPIQKNQIYTYTSFPYSYPANRPPSPTQTFRLPISTQINYATKQGQNCVCMYCRSYQKTRVKSKCSLFSYLCAFGLIITGCCCFYPCFHRELKNNYHYCSHCHKLLGHS
jgi:hypothetical protein